MDFFAQICYTKGINKIPLNAKCLHGCASTSLTDYTKGTREMATINSTTDSTQPQDKTIPDFIRVVQYIYDTQVVGHYDSSSPLREIEHFAQFFNIILDGVQLELRKLNEQKVQYLRGMDYQEYLQTDHWQTLRKAMLEYANYRCQLCNNGAVTLHVHHRSYENRGKEPLSDLIVLCADCHGKFHDKLAVQE